MDVTNAEKSPQDAQATTVEGHIRDIVRGEVLTARKAPVGPANVVAAPEPGGELIVPLIQKLGAGSIAEIERLIEELQAARDYLRAEGERIERETARYANLTRTATASVKIISESLTEWRKDTPRGAAGL
jgi:hypothetical protein